MNAASRVLRTFVWVACSCCAGLSEMVAQQIQPSVAALPPMLTKETKLKANDGAPGDAFGLSVAISGGTVVAGAYAKDQGSGSAYVFTQAGGVWTQQQTLIPSDPAPGDQFGFSVAVSGDTAVSGAYAKDQKAGSAYVFERSGGLWAERQKLAASDAAAGNSFGDSVGISGDTVIAGAVGNGGEPGAAYVLVRDGSIWIQQQKVTASDGTAEAAFGFAVAISGDTAVIGAPFDGEKGFGSGAAYVFAKSGNVWIQEQKLKTSDARPFVVCGESVAVNGDTVVIGCPFDDRKGFLTGSAYVFVRSGSTWTEQQKLEASDARANLGFGLSVAISGDRALVGAPGDAGYAYVFVRQDGVWRQRQILTASADSEKGSFGSSVGLSGDVAVIGDPGSGGSGWAHVYEPEASAPRPRPVLSDRSHRLSPAPRKTP